MDHVATPLPGAYIINPRILEDSRGAFIKLHHAPTYEKHGCEFTLRELFYTVSHKDVIRAMHFQTPPYAHVKIVQCVRGAVLDVLLDLRKDSPTYGKSFSIELRANKPQALYIPIGLAHGYQVLEDNSQVLYLTSYEYMPAHDTGVRWDSFGFDWSTKNPILSDRDRSFVAFGDYQSPF